jgi:hypothetical protein
MMQYIYTGSVGVEAELARDLLQASDMYLLEGLKRLCEAAMAQVGVMEAGGGGGQVCSRREGRR